MVFGIFRIRKSKSSKVPLPYTKKDVEMAQKKFSADKKSRMKIERKLEEARRTIERKRVEA